MPDNIFQVLTERGDLTDLKKEVGFSQSGIFGVLEKDSIEIGVLYSGKIGDFNFGKLELKSGGKGLLGTKLLKNYLVTMNWPAGTIGFEDLDSEIEFIQNKYGFSPTFHDGNVIVKSVIIDGPAFNAGVHPGMIIKSIDHYSFEGIDGFCDFVLDLKEYENNRILMTVDQNGVMSKYEIEVLTDH